MSPTSRSSSNLEGCSITSVTPASLSVNLGIRCNGVNSKLQVHEITNVEGSFRYEPAKIYQLAAQAAARDVLENDAEIDLGNDQENALKSRIEALLESESDNPQSGNASRLMPRGERHILLDRSPDHDQALVVSLVTEPNSDGSGSLYGVTYLYDDANEALTKYENLLAASD